MFFIFGLFRWFHIFKIICVRWERVDGMISKVGIHSGSGESVINLPYGFGSVILIK
jgi:hypothetical protein